MCYVLSLLKLLNMKDEVKQEPQAEIKKSTVASGVPYPVESVEDILESAKKIVAEYGTSKPISKEEIAKVLGRTVGTLSLFYSTLGQYGIFTLVHGKGHQPSDLCRRYLSPVHDNDEDLVKLTMFSSVPLYAKIISNLNGHTLPSDEKRFANLLKGDPYYVSENSAERAARVFLENCRQLNLRDHTGKFKFSIDKHSQENETKIVNPDHTTPPPSQPPPPPGEDLFELPIPLPNRRKAYLRYPIDDLSRKDILVITKALEFIASSLEDEQT